MIDLREEKKIAEAKKLQHQVEENRLLHLMSWPYEKMADVFRSWKAEYTDKADARLKQQAEANIYISDYFYEGRWVVALMCHNTLIDYCRIAGKYDYDPDGHPLDESPERLIRRMQELRQEEYLRLRRKEEEGKR